MAIVEAAIFVILFSIIILAVPVAAHAISRARKRQCELELALDDLVSQHHELKKKIRGGSEGDVDRWKRIAEEHLAVVYRYEAQRDEWKKKFMQETICHMNAIQLVEKWLQNDRELLVRALKLLNEVRKEAGQDPIKDAEELIKRTDPMAPPVGTAREFAKQMVELFTTASKDLDAAEEIRRLAGNVEEEPAEIRH